MINRTVAVVGCGPAGMLASHLLSHFNIDYMTFEKFNSPRAHPSAHWVSASSKLLISQIPGLNEAITSSQEDWKYFQYYRYSEGIFGQQLGVTNHFEPSIEQKLQTSRKLFHSYPSHIPQNKLLKIMYDHMANNEKETKLKFGQNITKIENRKTSQGTTYTLFNDKDEQVLESKYVILCNGVNSELRNQIFQMKGNSQLMDIINIHFTSKKLAEEIVKRNKNAMLHFIYGTKMLGILVNHSIQEGTFVLQIPNFLPILDLSVLYSGIDMIKMTLGLEHSNFLSDIKIIHIGKWKLQGILANKMHSQNILLAGDSAHAYPPAGGFGMNSGFQDITEAIHSIRALEKNKNLDSTKILSIYDDNRLAVNSRYLQKALSNLQITKKVSKKLGYPYQINDYFLTNFLVRGLSSFLPSSSTSYFQQIRTKVMNAVYRKKDLGSPGLDLFFDDFDLQAQRPSKIRHLILKENSTTDLSKHRSIWARKGVEISEVEKCFGQVEQKQIRYFDPNEVEFKEGQKIISSSGVVLLE